MEIQRTEPAPNDATPDSGASPSASVHGLHTVTGRTMREALLTARASLGQRSIVVQHRTDELGSGLRQVTLAVSTEVPRSTQDLDRLRSEAERMLGAVTSERGGAAKPAAPRRLSSGRSPLADVERRLRENGASKKLRESILETIVAKDDPDAHPLDVAAEIVGEAFEVATLPFQKGETTVLALLGQTGAGKTTTLAKLSARLVQAGRRVAIATLDVDRIGAAEQLSAFGDSIGVPAIALRDLDRFAAALGRDARYEVILIDGSGDIARDMHAVQSLRRALDGRTGGLDDLVERRSARVEALVTLPANASRASLAGVTDGLALVSPIGAVITKIDETTEPLPALEHASAAGLPIAFLTNGADLGQHFIRASKERFADVALMGKFKAFGAPEPVSPGVDE